MTGHVFIAELHWRSRTGEHRVDVFAGAERPTPVTTAYRRAKRLIRSGEAVAYTMRHEERDAAV